MSGASDDRRISEDLPGDGSCRRPAADMNVWPGRDFAEEEALRETAVDPLRIKALRETAVDPLRIKALRETAVDPLRMEVFIETMTPPGPAALRGLEEEALRQGVPVIRPQTQNLLRFFCALRRPRRILEIGTGTGFSTLFLQHYAPADCRILTIEKDPDRARLARLHFSRYGRPDSAASETEAPIRLLEGDALRILSEIRGDASFDLVFMDAAKGQYIRFLPDTLRLLRPGGILITDNILQEGEILSSRFAVTRRNRTIHSRMRAYLRALAEEPLLEVLLLPTGDGTAVCLKRCAKQEETGSCPGKDRDLRGQ